MNMALTVRERMLKTEAVVQRCSIKKVFLKISQNPQENTCARVSFLIKLKASAYNFIKKMTLARVFSCEFCKIFNNTFSTEYLQTTASVVILLIYWMRKTTFLYVKFIFLRFKTVLKTFPQVEEKSLEVSSWILLTQLLHITLLFYLSIE